MLLGGLRSVWLSHLLRQMSSSTGVCCVLAYRFSLLMISGLWILRILRRHWFIKVWIFFIDALVVHHVSAPYKNTDLTFELNKHTLVDVPINFSGVLYTFLACGVLIVIKTEAKASWIAHYAWSHVHVIDFNNSSWSSKKSWYIHVHTYMYDTIISQVVCWYM